MSPRVSIIMPTYNRAALVLETIESIRRQSFEDWELIVIDDGSEDDTKEIIAGIADSRITFYKESRVGVISKIRKLGISKASGEFIAFMDSDDLWAPTKLAEQVVALEDFSDAGLCLTGGYNFRDAGVPVDHFYPQRQGIKYGDLFQLFFKSELAVYSQALMFRKKCLGQVPFKETDNDVDFILRLTRNFNGLLLYQPLFFRRLHDNNYSEVNWKYNYQKGIGAIKSFGNGVEKQLVKEAFFKLYINFGEDCLMNKESKNAMRNFFRAWTNKPLSIIPFKKTGKAMLQYLKG